MAAEDPIPEPHTISPEETAVYEKLAELGISYQTYPHTAAGTIKDLEEIDKGIPGTRCKQLFLRDSGKGTRQYLIIADAETPIDLPSLATKLGETKLSFGSPDRLQRVLGVKPGAVSPFALINDVSHNVQVVVDASLSQRTNLSFHPNVNTATVVISAGDFHKFLGAMGNPIKTVQFR